LSWRFHSRAQVRQGGVLQYNQTPIRKSHIVSTLGSRRKWSFSSSWIMGGRPSDVGDQRLTASPLRLIVIVPSQTSQGCSDTYRFLRAICVSAANPTSKMSAVRQIKAIGVVSNMSALYRSFCVDNRGKGRRFCGNSCDLRRYLV
jgi:hypothetical protein